MLINADAKALEWVAGTALNNDVVATQEILNGVDQHSLNLKAFNLPSRLIAKKFIFRLIYGGTAYTYCNDADFMDVSTNHKYWQKAIDSFCTKYKGWASWWTRLIQEATTTGYVVNPYTNRTYEYKQLPNGDWPVTTIKNYIVQGFAADMMAIIRVAFYKRFMSRKIEGKLISSVHDSIVVDAPAASKDAVVALFNEVFNDFPMLFEQWFHKPFNLPLRCELSVGPNMLELVEI